MMGAAAGSCTCGAWEALGRWRGALFVRSLLHIMKYFVCVSCQLWNSTTQCVSMWAYVLHAEMLLNLERGLLLRAMQALCAYGSQCMLVRDTKMRCCR